MHLKHLTFLYCATCDKYDLHHLIFSAPLHYGIWYPYNYFAIVLGRNFYLMLNNLMQSDLKIGDDIFCHRKLVYVEKLFAGCYFPYSQ